LLTTYVDNEEASDIMWLRRRIDRALGPRIRSIYEGLVRHSGLIQGMRRGNGDDGEYGSLLGLYEVLKSEVSR
jgi:hypothetical protein